MITLSYSNVKYTPRVSLILPTVEKVERKNFDLVVVVVFLFLFFSFLSSFISLFLSFFPSCIS